LASSDDRGDGRRRLGVGRNRLGVVEDLVHVGTGGGVRVGVGVRSRRAEPSGRGPHGPRGRDAGPPAPGAGKPAPVGVAVVTGKSSAVVAAVVESVAAVEGVAGEIILRPVHVVDDVAAVNVAAADDGVVPYLTRPAPNPARSRPPGGATAVPSGAIPIRSISIRPPLRPAASGACAIGNVTGY